MGHPLTRRPPSPPPPRLVRSRNGSEKDSLISSIMNTASQRFTTTTGIRSKSTAKSRNTSQRFTTRSHQDQKTKEYSSDDQFVRFLQRGTSPRDSPAATAAKTKVPKSTSNAATSPSAWALSPGRSMSLFNNISMFPVPAEKLPAVVGGGERGKVKVGGGGVSGVLKFFRQKKVSPAVEEEYHKFRVLQNRLMQWKFVNAKTEATMSSIKTVAEDRLFHVWLRILNVRSIIVDNRMEIQRMKQDMKLCKIIYRQMSLLNSWEKIECKNCEALSMITRKVSALSVRMPLIDEAKGDVESIYDAMSKAMELMGNIVATITKFLSQVEKVLYLLTELTTTLQLQEESLGEVEKIVTFLSLLFAREKSVRIQLIQLVKE